MKKSLFIMAGTLAIVIASLWFTACEREKTDVLLNDDRIVEDRTNADTLVFLPNAKPYGKSYKDWTVAWMRQFLAFNTTKGQAAPYTKETLELQTSPVWFLNHLCSNLSANTVATNTIRVPSGKAILFPIVNFINSYPCANSPQQPVPGQNLEDFLRKGALKALADIKDLYVEIDGQPVSHPYGYQFTPRMFSFTGDPTLASCFDVCFTGLPQRAVTSGYYMMLKPLKKGPHTIRFHATLRSLHFMQDGVYNLLVV